MKALLTILIACGFYGMAQGVWAAESPQVNVKNDPYGSFQRPFDQGNTAYDEGRYQDAIMHYTTLLESGVANGTVHYNLGNAYVKLGRKGRGIVEYERALRRDPSDSMARQNLEWVQLQIEDKIIPRGGSWISKKLKQWLAIWHIQLSWTLVSIANVCFFLLAALAVHFKSYRLRIKPFLWSVGWILIISVLWVAAQSMQANVKEGVVVMNEVPVRFAPSGQGQIAFTLHDGTACEIRSELPGWVRVRIADGKVGWLESQAIEEI
jgi:tetratricopeptide (TPR) repeat protein